MSNRNKTPKGSKYEKKMVLAAFSPIGVPKSLGCERHILSYAGMDNMTSDRRRTT